MGEVSEASETERGKVETENYKEIQPENETNLDEAKQYMDDLFSK